VTGGEAPAGGHPLTDPGPAGRTRKVVSEEIPPGYHELPEAERKKIARRLARQVRAWLGHRGTVSEQLGLPKS